MTNVTAVTAPGGDTTLRVSGGLAMFGAAAMVAANVAGSIVVDGHSIVRETISDLAAGRYAWIQDLGLLLYALGLLALAVGLFRLGLGGWLWRAGALAVLVMAPIVLLIGIHDAYGDQQPGGIVIHSRLVWTMGGLFGAALLLLAPGLGEIGPGWRRGTLIAAALWIVLAPPFFFMPTGFDGLYERGLGLIMLGWVFATGTALLHEGRASC